LGRALFERVGRQPLSTGIGRILLDYAGRIIGTVEELFATLERGQSEMPPLRIWYLLMKSRRGGLSLRHVT
jgi:DNA-binding transcriptional LysR family regulator